MIVTSHMYAIQFLLLCFRLLTKMKGRSLLPRKLVSRQQVKRLLRRVVVVSLAASPPAVNQERRKKGMLFNSVKCCFCSQL